MKSRDLAAGVGARNKGITTEISRIKEKETFLQTVAEGELSPPKGGKRFRDIRLEPDVTVRDDGRPSLSSTTRVVIAVADINDHGPEFEQKFYTVQIPASPYTDKPLFQVRYPPLEPPRHRSS
ncbi:hypothetical protein K0M31_012892 [Melipona bicolor]|uniref:Cadherin domain-containing protein n=1 Tax=Melipona bicolor TaxID=60889 RepID=A0AA40KGR0_9HYME|nr:hypothetical protein K0M31_012892 [Melipona bicolor]